MNPYDFVRVDWQTGPDRKPPLKHNSFSGISGRIAASITAETPVFFKQGESPYSVRKDDQFIIPGTTLKGMLRSVVETVGQGCFHKFSGSYEKKTIDYNNKLDNQFKACTDPDRLCIGCRLFGMITQKRNAKVHKGSIAISDAEEVVVKRGGQFILKSMATPNPRHDAFYLDDSKNHISGRKYYFHSHNQLSGREGDFNVDKIFPLQTGSRFQFYVHCDNITQSDLTVLLYALILEDSMRHKIGYAKPLGFGSIKIDINEIRLVDRHKRYSGSDDTTILRENSLTEYINENVNPGLPFESITITDLRRIWQWPPVKGVHYDYPDQKWFGDNHQARIEDSP